LARQRRIAALPPGRRGGIRHNPAGGWKEKTRRWERRVRVFIVIGVYGFKYAAWLYFDFFVIGQPIFTFLLLLISSSYFSQVEFNRTLLIEARVSVVLRTH